MPPSSSDVNLLFGILAVQMNFVNRDALIQGMNAWVLQKHRPLGALLVEQGALRQDMHDALAVMVQKHVEVHGDAQKSLAALGSVRSVRHDLERIADPEVQRSIGHVGAAAGEADSSRTHAPAATAAFRAVRYKRLRPHARGGLGEVFVALDEELHREVALKEIQNEHADHPENQARFLVEAEITGNLEHPGVVPIYGLGRYDDGRPYYAMRFVRGDSLKDAVKRFHRQESSLDAGRRSVELRGLLGRFLDVCDAVAYAHSRGVLHRDLKPGNVMLGRYGETLVVDWGLAKLLGRVESRSGEDVPLITSLSGDSTPTQAGATVGTPEYMSPEQAAGRLDLLGPRSDVYSLGATLYCLLTGQAPFAREEKENLGALLRKVEQGDFPPPRRVKPDIPRPLEAICRKAMARLGEDRYGSVEALAGDVRQWLADEPVSAYREPLADRARRWSRRHRTLVSVGVALLLAGVAALGVGLWVVNEEKERTARQRDRAVEAEEREAERRGEAEANLARAEKAEKEAKGNLKQARDNLKLAREAIDECFNIARTDPLFQGPRMEKARNLLLRKTLRFYRNFRVQRPDDRGLQWEEADQWFRVGYIEQVLLRTNQAREAYERARALFQALVKAHHDVPGYQNDLASTHNDLGVLLDDLGKRDEALEEYQQARRLRRKLVGAHPDVPGYQKDLAKTHNNLGVLLDGLGRRDEALEGYQQARRLRRKLVEAHPDVPGYQNDLAATHNSLGNLLAGLGRRDEALKEYQQARDLRRKLVEAHPDVPGYQNDLARTHYNLGLLLDGLGRRDEALKESQQARRLGRKLVEAHPDVPEYTADFARTCLARGSLLQQMNRVRESLADLDQGIAQTDRLHELDPNHPRIGPFLLFGLPRRASLLTSLRRGREADADWERVLKIAPAAQRFGLRLQRADSRARAGDYQRSAAEAEEVAGTARAPSVLYDLACVQALNAGSASRNRSRPLPEREKHAEQHARTAVALLKRSASAGFFRDRARLAELDKDPDLTFLRDRDDYKQFRAGLKPAKSHPFDDEPLPSALDGLPGAQEMVREYAMRYILVDSFPADRTWDGLVPLNDLFESEEAPPRRTPTSINGSSTT
jgi:serine/threonine-protein kinase